MQLRGFIFVTCFMASWSLAPCASVEAQTGTDILNILNPSAELAITPRHPEPGQEVTVVLNDYSFESTGATITWFIDGEEIPALENQRRATLLSKQLGESTAVEIVSTLVNGQRVTASGSFRSSRVDFLVEANTLTPTFYRGRALPTAGSQVRVTAIPFISGSTNPANFSYEWEVAGEIIDGGAVRGKNATVFRSEFQSSMPVKVTVYNNQGAVVTSKSTRVVIADPEIHFYELNPLRGLLPIVLNNQQPLIGQEMTLRAEPYFYDPTALGANAHIEWKLNGLTVENGSSDPFTITLQRTGDQSSVRVGLELRNLRQLLQGAEADLTLRL